jgi:signal peptidase I
MSARRLVVAGIATLACVLLGFGAVLWHDGYRMYVIHTGSMQPTLNPGDVIIDKPVGAHTVLEPGEIITFRHSDLTTDVVTHRFTGYTETGLIDTKGDANETADPWQIRPPQVTGAEAYVVPRLGYLVVFLRQPSGVASVVTALLGLILLWGLFFPDSAQQILRRIPGTHRRHRRNRRHRHEPAHVLVASRTQHRAPKPPEYETKYRPGYATEYRPEQHADYWTDYWTDDWVGPDETQVLPRIQESPLDYLFSPR